MKDAFAIACDLWVLQVIYRCSLKQIGRNKNTCIFNSKQALMSACRLDYVAPFQPACLYTIDGLSIIHHCIMCLLWMNTTLTRCGTTWIGFAAEVSQEVSRPFRPFNTNSSQVNPITSYLCSPKIGLHDSSNAYVASKSNYVPTFVWGELATHECKLSPLSRQRKWSCMHK